MFYDVVLVVFVMVEIIDFGDVFFFNFVCMMWGGLCVLFVVLFDVVYVLYVWNVLVGIGCDDLVVCFGVCVVYCVLCDIVCGVVECGYVVWFDYGLVLVLFVMGV